MKTKLYTILLDQQIGTSELEKADAPMGVVGGKIIFADIDSGYDFFRTYCLNNGITINNDLTDERYISTAAIPKLKIINQNGIEIKGEGTVIEGFDGDTFEVTILGVPYPFFEEEFPHHVKAYSDRFKSD